ncbi:MAG: hypothetical protein PVG82_04620 [Chromatiales bacterium]|jgi:hypothetical protein
MAPTQLSSGGRDAGAPTASRDEIKQVLAADSLLRGAHRFARAAEMQAAKEHTVSAPTALLASHCLDLTLKAYLIFTGHSRPHLEAIGHNLLESWSAAVERGLALPTPAPEWCCHLSAAYDYPGPVVLKRRTRVRNSLDASHLVADLNGVVSTVEEALQAPSVVEAAGVPPKT